MPNSRRWNALRRAVLTLRTSFLPDPFDPLGSYPRPARVQAHTRAFVVLAHAEVESYLEEWAKDIARACELVWTSRHRPTVPLSFLIATTASSVSVPRSLSGTGTKDSPQRLADAVVVMFQAYYKLIKDNHGIKEVNVLGLFGPLGIPASALSGTLIPNLDTLGTVRGDLAHASAKSVRNTLDPQTEFSRVEHVLNDLIALDQWFVQYRKKVR